MAQQFGVVVRIPIAAARNDADTLACECSPQCPGCRQSEAAGGLDHEFDLGPEKPKRSDQKTCGPVS